MAVLALDQYYRNVRTIVSLNILALKQRTCFASVPPRALLSDFYSLPSVSRFPKQYSFLLQHQKLRLYVITSWFKHWRLKSETNSANSCYKSTSLPGIFYQFDFRTCYILVAYIDYMKIT